MHSMTVTCTQVSDDVLMVTDSATSMVASEHEHLLQGKGPNPQGSNRF